jgi:hypothetical protein
MDDRLGVLVSDIAPLQSTTELDGISIVVLGNFNPTIFSPAWFRLHNLIGKSEADDAQVQMIVPPAAIFATDWLSVQVTQDRLVLATIMPQEFERLRDTAVGVMTILDQTPIQAVGINRECHWASSDRETYDQFGDTLVPKERWSGVLNLAGTQDLTVRGVRADKWAGWIDVTVQPSVRVTPFGIYVRVNDHCWLVEVDHQPSARGAPAGAGSSASPPTPSSDLIPHLLAILRGDWSERLDNCDRIIKMVRTLSRRTQ